MSYHSPQSSKNESESNSQILIVGGIFLGMGIVAFLLFNLLVNTIIGFIPPSLEQKLGAVIAPVYEQQAVDSPQQKTLNQLLDRLEANLPEEQKNSQRLLRADPKGLSHAKHDDGANAPQTTEPALTVGQYDVLYVPENTVNAIAIPGNKIIIYQGLLKEVESENELMMILGHELGHFANRDHLRGLGNVLVLRVTISYLLGDASIFKSIVASSIRAISNAHYSQKQEKQADKFGLMLLDKTYGQVAGATDFFQKLGKRSSDFDFLASHPAPIKRVKEIEKLIQVNGYSQGSTLPLPEELKVE